jgi:hypothetical protein
VSPSASKSLQMQNAHFLRQKSNHYNEKSIGRFTVFCRGKYVRSPDFFCSMFTAVLIIVPSLLMIIFGYGLFSILISHSHSIWPSITA